VIAPFQAYVNAIYLYKGVVASSASTVTQIESTVSISLSFLIKSSNQYWRLIRYDFITCEVTDVMAICNIHTATASKSADTRVGPGLVTPLQNRNTLMEI